MSSRPTGRRFTAPPAAAGTPATVLPRAPHRRATSS